MALLRFILLIIVILLVLQLIGRIFFGYFIRRYFNSSQNHQPFDDNRKEGDIHINLRKDNKKKFIQKDEGEYVKYEEIRDDD